MRPNARERRRNLGESRRQPEDRSESRPTKARARRSAADRAEFDSPTAPIRHVLITLSITVLIVMLLGARGIVHAADGLPYSPFQTALLSVGNGALAVTQTLHLTWPWDDLEAAVGNGQQTGGSSLLTAAPTIHKSKSGSKRARGVGTSHRAGIPSGTDVNSRTPARHHHVGPVWPALPAVTRKHPLRLLITGDSLPGWLGPQILNGALPTGRVTGWTETHDGTGLCRPDFVDWAAVARRQVTSYHPQAIVMFLGGNDFQNMTLWNGKVVVAGSPAWTREYQRRAAIVMRIWIHGGVKRVYWLSMPPASNPQWSYDYYRINIAVRAAARQVPGVHFLNVNGPITNHGRYEDYVNVGGQPVLTRESDGLHLNIAGSNIVAGEVLPVIKREWHLTRQWTPHPRKRTAARQCRPGASCRHQGPSRLPIGAEPHTGFVNRQLP